MPRPAKNPDVLVALIDHLADAIVARIGGGSKAVSPKAPAGRKRNFSAAGIERIRAAAKKRWAKYRRDKKAAAK
jgi:hypothetical protein